MSFYKILFEFIKVNNKEYDIIHVNEFLAIPILPFIKKKHAQKIIVHLRTMITNKNNFLKKICFSIVEKYVDKIIAIDKNVVNCLPSELKKSDSYL